MTKVKLLLSIAMAASLGLMLPDAASAATDTGVVKPNFEHALPNVPGKSLKAVEVYYPAGGASLPHTHAGSAFIYAYVVEGQIVSQVEGQPEQTYSAGESWYEVPGAHHVVSRNASKTRPAKLLAVFVVDSGDKNLTTMDKQEKPNEPTN